METVEVVIRIPKEVYEKIQQIDRIILGRQNGKTIEFALWNGVKNGTVLPKGHGRLIDADAINIHDVSPTYGMEVYGVTQDDIEYEPTVIEADREVQDEK